MTRPLPLLLVLVAACGEDVLWVDPDVTLTGENDGQHGPRDLVLGFGEGRAFAPLEHEAPIPVINGLQGGTWTMPTLRAESLAASLLVRCELTTAAGEALGATEVQVPTRPAPATSSTLASGPGWVEVAQLPIAVTHAPPRATEPIVDLDGITTTLGCTVSAAGQAATASHSGPLDVPEAP